MRWGLYLFTHISKNMFDIVLLNCLGPGPIAVAWGGWQSRLPKATAREFERRPKADRRPTGG